MLISDLPEDKRQQLRLMVEGSILSSVIDNEGMTTEEICRLAEARVGDLECAVHLIKAGDLSLAREIIFGQKKPN